MGRPVLHALSLHSVVLTELINCVHMALMNIVVKDYLRLGDGGRLVGAALLLDGGHDIDSAVPFVARCIKFDTPPWVSSLNKSL